LGEGVYFEFAINASSTLLLSLYNSHPLSEQISTAVYARQRSISPPPLPLELSGIENRGPISLLVLIDDDDYIILPNVTSTVRVQRQGFDPNSSHRIRVIAPMVDSVSACTLRFGGLWLDRGGNLVPLNPFLEQEYADDSKTELATLGNEGATRSISPSRRRGRRMLEIVTDFPGLRIGKGSTHEISFNHIILGGVMGWEYLLGEMFAADHVTIGVDGMCLVQGCIGGTSSPTGIADVFFQRSQRFLIQI
jgi:hypothetical protein